MNLSLRSELENLANGSRCQNAGLALERYLESQEKEVAANQALLQNVARMSSPVVYAEAFARWQATLDKLGARREQFVVADRLIVGLGSESVLETGITLNRIYGVPMIPGSALKGLARHYFLHEIAVADKEPFHVLFGDTTRAGYITFFDAWYVPGSAPDNRPLMQDVITVHHPDYYSSKGVGASPTDFDDPNPIGFVSATGTYLVAVHGPTPEWTDCAFELLRRALREYGVGGKTSSGYGRLVDQQQNPEPRQNRDTGQSPAVPRAKHPLVRNIELIPNNQLVNRIYGFYQQWEKMPDGPDKREVAQALHSKLLNSSVKNRWNGEPLIKVAEYLKQRGQ